jgi:hypothetical protein
VSACPLSGKSYLGLKFLIKCWETMATRDEFQGLKDTLMSIKSLHKWYGRANGANDSTSPAYFICLGKVIAEILHYSMLMSPTPPLVLDPNIKDLYFWGWWNHEQYTVGMSQLEDVVSSVVWY